ncbi:MAG: GNAT family N-acetyltransferase [Micromonosporaceae bacterium]|nr:GNAT family N-acetyltransferase [Micromonosporaceae bacterium]
MTVLSPVAPPEPGGTPEAVALGPLEQGEVRQVARLHEQAFPGFFLSALGEPFLVQLYRGFLKDSSAVTVVARDREGRILGAVVGTTAPAGFFKRLLQRQCLGFILASLQAVARNPAAVTRLLRAVTYRGVAPGSSGGALLSSICVVPSARGTGLGRRLLRQWTSEVARRGVSTAFLTTDANGNATVNRFYQAQGWVLSETFRTREGRSMNCYTTRTDPR